MTRSVWKGPFVDITLLKKAEKLSQSGRKEVLKTWSRRSTILPQFVGITFNVYNGKKFMLKGFKSQQHRSYFQDSTIDGFHTNFQCSKKGINYVEQFNCQQLFEL